MEHLMQFFEYGHYVDEQLKPVAKLFRDLANEVRSKCPVNAETTTALRKLLEAKDCAVRSLIAK